MLQNAAHEVEILRVEHHEMESMYEAVSRHSTDDERGAAHRSSSSDMVMLAITTLSLLDQHFEAILVRFARPTLPAHDNHHIPNRLSWPSRSSYLY